MRNDVFDVLPLVRYLGNSREALNSTRFIPFFIGMMLGILFGLIPFHIPGLSTPIRLGTSGGPLLTALLLSYRGSLGRIIFYTPTIVLNAFKEFGIILFLGMVGLSSGAGFFQYGRRRAYRTGHFDNGYSSAGGRRLYARL